jgi:phosphoglucomutase
MNRNEIKQRAEEYVELETNAEFRESVEKLLREEQWEELSERFYTDLSFGTGGIRGKIAGGYNRINPLVIARATQGLANYIGKQQHKGQDAVVIAYDSRRYSRLFAEETALVLAGNGIKVYLFSELRPTPELSYAVRKLGATAGVVITASHNPPEYNGYKVYWSDGGQIVPPHDKGIITEVRQVTREISRMDKQEALDSEQLVYIDREIDTDYIDTIKKHALRPDLIRKKGKDLKVVYTPLHGTGTMLMERIFEELGIEVVTVPEQREPDGNFPTVEYPNPEESSAMEKAIELGEEVKADLVLGTDPDSDRLGIAVPHNEGFILINGNQLGSLLADYIFSTLYALGNMPENPVLVKTIVTTELQTLIAKNYGARVYDTLTGFKYIAEKIKQFESTGESYVFGGEESYGYLVGTEVRDKDAIGAAAMTAEMALYDVSRGKTVLDHLDELYEKYGYFEERLLSKKYEGQAGAEKMNTIMANLREDPPSTFGGSKVVTIKDYQERVSKNRRDGTTEPLELPVSNVLQFLTEDNTIISVRPSGTEPKIKIYASARSDASVPPREASRQVGEKLDTIEKEISSLFD